MSKHIVVKVLSLGGGFMTVTKVTNSSEIHYHTSYQKDNVLQGPTEVGVAPISLVRHEQSINWRSILLESFTYEKAQQSFMREMMRCFNLSIGFVK